MQSESKQKDENRNRAAAGSLSVKVWMVSLCPCVCVLCPPFFCSFECSEEVSPTLNTLPLQFHSTRRGPDSFLLLLLCVRCHVQPQLALLLLFLFFFGGAFVMGLW